MVKPAQDPQSAREYEDRTTQAAKSVLIEIGQILGSYRGRFAIIGGAVPWLLLDNEEMPHVGTLDVDLSLDAAALGLLRRGPRLARKSTKQYKADQEQARRIADEIERQNLVRQGHEATATALTAAEAGFAERQAAHDAEAAAMRKAFEEERVALSRTEVEVRKAHAARAKALEEERNGTPHTRDRSRRSHGPDPRGSGKRRGRGRERQAPPAEMVGIPAAQGGTCR